MIRTTKRITQGLFRLMVGSGFRGIAAFDDFRD
jgi:hypothetical protein